MEQTITISLCNLVFKIEESAYQQFKTYLGAIGNQFDDPDERSEIMTDIEGRVAELLLEKKKEADAVITNKDIEEVISILGTPDEFAKDNQEPFKDTTKSKSYNASDSYEPKDQKRVYRDTEHSVIAGVCNGLAAYFNIDPLIFRVLFIITALFSGLGFIIYIVLWIVLPIARTPKERLEMRGSKVNFSNIRNSINEESHKVKSNLNNLRKSETMDRTVSVFLEILLVFGLMLKFILKLVVAIIGFAILFGGLFLIILLVGVLFFDINTHFPGGHIGIMTPAELFALFPKYSDSWMLLIAVFLIICIPLLMLVIGGIKMMAGSHVKVGAISLGAFVLWVLMLILAAALILPEAKKIHIATTSSIARYEIPAKIFDGIVLTTNNNYEKPSITIIPFMGSESYGLYNEPNSDSKLYLGKADINVCYSQNDTFKISVEKQSLGISKKLASENNGKITYNLILSDSIINLDSYFTTNYYPFLSAPKVKVTIYLPESKGIVFEQQALNDFDSVLVENSYANKDSLANEVWILNHARLEKESDRKPKK